MSHVVVVVAWSPSGRAPEVLGVEGPYASVAEAEAGRADAVQRYAASHGNGLRAIGGYVNPITTAPAAAPAPRYSAHVERVDRSGEHPRVYLTVDGELYAVTVDEGVDAVERLDPLRPWTTELSLNALPEARREQIRTALGLALAAPAGPLEVKLDRADVCNAGYTVVRLTVNGRPFTVDVFPEHGPEGLEGLYPRDRGTILLMAALDEAGRAAVVAAVAEAVNG